MFDLRVETVRRVARRLGALQERLRARDVGGEGREVVGGERDRVRRLPQQQELHEVSKHCLQFGVFAHVVRVVRLEFLLQQRRETTA